ncbi:MAG: hypothetical protein JNM80_06280 [Phycisphaerae bacterium]|nr:hypothetical protein [Phycisphaerae bacterium]
MRIRALVASVGLALPAVALAQTQFLLADRTLDSIWLVDDRNGNGVIDEPGEVSLWFSAANAAGTIGLNNPSALASRSNTMRGHLAYVGDQGLEKLFYLHDLNQDGDSLDIGESLVALETGNAAGIRLAFPTGIAIDGDDSIYVANAGNALAPDAVYHMKDLNGDGDFMDAGEVTLYVGEPVFGVGNGPYSPQELLIAGGDANGPVCFLRNSSANLHGVFRFHDDNGNGRADDPGEFTVFFDATNLSGVTVSAGFAVEPDPARPGSIYYHQLATGAVDQVYRLTDLNNDRDANDAGEAVLVFSTAETGFSSIDVGTLPSGQVLVTDNSGKRVIVLTDLDMDGLFNSAGERATYFANSSLIVGDIRQVSALSRPCVGNCDRSGLVPILNVNDFVCFLSNFAAGSMAANCDSSTTPPVLNVNDFSCFLNAFAGGCG